MPFGLTYWQRGKDGGLERRLVSKIFELRTERRYELSLITFEMYFRLFNRSRVKGPLPRAKTSVRSLSHLSGFRQSWKIAFPMVIALDSWPARKTVEKWGQLLFLLEC